MEIQEYFKEIETSKEYKGYFCKIGDVIATVILGSICGLKNVSQINQWANNKKVSKFLKEKFKIESVPCYYWMLCLLKIIKPESLNKCFTRWVSEMVEGKKEYTIAVDGKSVRSSEKAIEGISALHIVSAHIAELGITIGQKSVEGKSNEIPAVENLLNKLNISGCLIVQKLALNLLKSFKTKSNSKKPISKIMFDCLLDSDVLWGIFEN